MEEERERQAREEVCSPSDWHKLMPFSAFQVGKHSLAPGWTDEEFVAFCTPQKRQQQQQLMKVLQLQQQQQQQQQAKLSGWGSVAKQPPAAKSLLEIQQEEAQQMKQQQKKEQQMGSSQQSRPQTRVVGLHQLLFVLLQLGFWSRHG